MAEINLQEEIKARVQAMTAENVTQFEVIIVDGVVRRWTEGLVETPLRRLFQSLPLQGRSQVAWGEVTLTAVNTAYAFDPFNVATTLQSFTEQSRQRIRVPWGWVGGDVKVPKVLDWLGTSPFDELRTRARELVVSLVVTEEKFILEGNSATTGQFDGLQVLIPSAQAITVPGVGSKLSYANVVEMCKKVVDAGGSPTYLVANAVDIENILNEAMNQRRYSNIVTEVGQGPIERIHTEYGTIQPIRHPLIPASGTRYAFVLDPARQTGWGPALHLRYLVSREPFRVQVPDTDLEYRRVFMHAIALAAPGRHFQARAEITNAP